MLSEQLTDAATQKSTKRSKRPRVSAENRKRVAVACKSCQYVKEKCYGGIPCSRCTRLKRHCEVRNTIDSPRALDRQASTQDGDYLDAERVSTLERLLRHYVPGLALDKHSIERHLVELNVPSTGSSTAKSTDVSAGDRCAKSRANQVDSGVAISEIYSYSGDLSHCKFFDSVQSRIDERSGNLTNQAKTAAAIGASIRTMRLLSAGSIILDAASCLPPIEVSRFLVDMFFRFAKTNYSYIDESSFHTMMDRIYSKKAKLKTADSPIVCVVLMVLALGTQFAHLSSSENGNIIFRSIDDSDDIASPDDTVALGLYHAATMLIPDVLISASIESVQALLLLGVYTLPIDAAGLAYTYLGMAIRIAVRIELHRNLPQRVDAIESEVRNRIWWTAYTLEKRIAVLHGMPVALNHTEVDAKLPTDIPALRNTDGSSNISNFVALIKITCALEDAGSTICTLRHASGVARSSAMTTLSLVVSRLSEYWNSLPVLISCRDLTPTGALFRPNVHLNLTYHLIRVFIGRNFIFDSIDSLDEQSFQDYNKSTWIETREKLVSSCMESALAIIELCQLLQTEIGLARASYTEFTSCRTAVLVIIAKRIQENNMELQNASERGLELLRYISVGIYSAEEEKEAIRAMETAVRRLNRLSVQQSSSDHEHDHDQPNSAYTNFRSWAELWSKDGNQPSRSASSMASKSQTTLGDTDISSDKAFTVPTYTPFNEYDPIMSAFPFGFGGEASMLDYGPDFIFDLPPRN